MDEIKNVEDLIGSGKLDQAIRQLLSLSESRKPNIKNYILHESSRLSTTQSDFNKGLIEITNLQFTRNHITLALLGYLDEFRERDDSNLESSENKKDKDEIKQILKLFDRAVFEASLNSEEVTAMFDAIQNVRLAMQFKHAGLIENPRAAELFREIWKELLNVEGKVIDQYPKVFEALAELKNQPTDWNRRRRAEEIVGKQECFDAINLMMGIRSIINPKLEEVTKIYRS